MATGYTACIQDRDVTFGEFVWRCARAFGALLPMREEPMDAEIPEKFAASDYYEKEIARLKTELAKLEGMPDHGVLQEEAADRVEAEQSQQKSRERKARTKQRYETMLEKVRAWKPPTPEHEGLRSFMINQIEESIRWDCSDWNPEPPKVRSVPTYRAEQIASLKQDLVRAQKNYDEELERTRLHNEWIAALRASVPYERPKK
jgi:hypothetical protein